MKVLVSDSLSEKGIELLKKEEDIEVEVKTGLSPEELVACIGSYEALVVRSGTKVTREVIEAGKNLKVIGRAGVGVDNVDLKAATEKKIRVLNAPAGNTISAAEHTVGLILALSRNLPQAYRSLKSKKWERKKFMGVEVYNKILGIIGLGRIGKEVAKRAKGLGMKVMAYDPLISGSQAEGIKLVELEELLREADYITLHTPLNEETRHLLGKKEFEVMKKGVRVINCGRGGIIDEGSLSEALKEGKVAGAALDVYEKEPPLESPLLELDSVIAVPHLGASTREAQERVALEVGGEVINALKGKEVKNWVNKF
jgi:D-3-phosphoglycerate dehydrogenase